MDILNLPVGLREALEARIEQLRNLNPYSREGKPDFTPTKNEKQEQPTSDAPSGKNIQRPWTILAFFVVFVFLFSMSFPSRKVSSSSAKHSRPAHTQWSPNATTEDHYFHILIPTPSRSMSLCKTFLSGSVLHYPTPWTVSWNPNIEQTTTDLGGIAEKMEYINKFLSEFDAKRENDTLLVLNNPNSWFQARPEVLLARYHDALSLDSQRLVRKHGQKVLDAAHVKPRILFATDIDCSPLLQAGGRGCYGIEAPDHKLRYISPDFLMGSISDLKTVYQEAATKAMALASELQTFTWNEHTIFTDLLYEQESHRTSRSLPEQPSDRKDLGITLDFNEQIRYAAAGTAQDAEWRQDVSSSKSAGGPPQDILNSASPFWTVQGTLPSLSWSQVPLLTNTRTHTTPVLIQIGHDTSSDLPRDWYSNLWFQRHGRVLLDNHIFSPVVPIALVRDKGTGIVKRFWPTPQKRGNGMNEWKKVQEWLELCREQDPAEVFLDHKGVWKDPRP